MRLPKSKRELLPLLEQAGLKPHRGWGQNFLLDANLLAAIPRLAEVKADDVVLEIGSGPATLTEYLLERADLVIAVELDRGMAAFTTNALADTENLLLLNADMLEGGKRLNAQVLAHIHDALRGEFPDAPTELALVVPKRKMPTHTSLKVAANLPYSVASPIVIGLLESDLPITSMTVMLQLEVARRLAAKPGDDDYGLLTVLRALNAEAHVLRKVSRTCFWPKPKVDSALVRIEPIPRERRLPEREYAAVKHVASALFQYRRKSLTAAAKHGLGLSADEARGWLARAGIGGNAHAENLGIADFCKLAAALPKTDA